MKHNSVLPLGEKKGISTVPSTVKDKKLIFLKYFGRNVWE